MANFMSKTVLALGVAMGSGAALADVITLNQEIILTPAQFYAGRAFDVLFNAQTTPLLIHQGDTIDMTVNFLRNDAVHIASTGGIQAFSMELGQDMVHSPRFTSNFTASNISFNLIGAQGSFPALVHGSDLSVGPGSGSLFVNPNGYFMSAGQSVTFTGMHTRFTVSALENGESYYRGSHIYAYGDQVTPVFAPLPEPETWAMLLGGLGLLAFMHKRRASRSVTLG